MLAANGLMQHNINQNLIQPEIILWLHFGGVSWGERWLLRIIFNQTSLLRAVNWSLFIKIGFHSKLRHIAREKMAVNLKIMPILSIGSIKKLTKNFFPIVFLMTASLSLALDQLLNFTQIRHSTD